MRRRISNMRQAVVAHGRARRRAARLASQVLLVNLLLLYALLAGCQQVIDAVTDAVGDGSDAPAAVESVVLFPEMIGVAIAGTAQLTAEIVGAGSPSQDVTWASKDESVATVDMNGLVTGIAEGTTSVVATSAVAPDVSGSAEVRVSRWNFMESATLAGLNAIWGSEAAGLFAVGDSGSALHNDGTGWRVMATPTTRALEGVWGTGPDNVYAIGQQVTILHYDGEEWRQVASPTDRGAERFYGIWGSGPDDIFVVGHSHHLVVPDRGTIIHFDGAGWSLMDSPTMEPLYSVWGSGPDNVFAVGRRGTILHYDGDAWRELDSPTRRHLYAVWGTSADTVLAVGTGTIIQILDHGDAEFSIIENQVPYQSRGVWGSGSEMFVVGGGPILYDDGSSLHEMTSPTQELRAVWGMGGSMFAVGANGVIVHLDGRP